MTRNANKPASVDVLVMMDAIIRRHESAARAYRAPAGKSNHRANDAAKMREARDAVAELIDMALIADEVLNARGISVARGDGLTLAAAVARIGSGSTDA